MQPRFHRRTAILRGKRSGAFDRDQYYLEAANRARVGRKLRVYLRRREPVVLETPRWSLPIAFLDDVASDLQLGSPALDVQPIALHPVVESTNLQLWRSLAETVLGACAVGAEHPARERFARNDFAGAVDRALTEGAPHRCLMVCGVEHLPDEVLRELIAVVEATAGIGTNVVLAGEVSAAQLPLDVIHPLFLADFGDREAVEALVEQLGPATHLHEVAAVCGGIPAALQAMVAPLTAGALPDRDAVWRALGEVGRQIEVEWANVAGDPLLHDRMRRLATDGALPVDPELDHWLYRAGLVRSFGDCTELRAPLMQDLAW